MRNEVQVILTALSIDEENLLDPLAIIGASAALTISDVPGTGRWRVRPSASSTASTSSTPRRQRWKQPAEPDGGGHADNILMVEAGAHEIRRHDARSAEDGA